MGYILVLSADIFGYLWVSISDDCVNIQITVCQFLQCSGQSFFLHRIAAATFVALKYEIKNTMYFLHLP